MVVGAGFGGVVGYEDDRFVLRAEGFEDFNRVREEGVARPENTYKSDRVSGMRCERAWKGG